MVDPIRCRTRAGLVAAALLVAGAQAACAAQQPGGDGISAVDVARHIAVLAHDSLRGRTAPGPALDSAAKYVAEELRRMGLLPGVGDSAFISHFAHQLRQLHVEAVSLTAGGAGMHDVVYGRDFAAFYGSVERGEGHLLVATGEEVMRLAPNEVRGRVLLVVLPEHS